MKKMILLFLSIYCFVLAIYAQGETQHFVVKNGDNVTVYQITNPAEFYDEVSIEVVNFTNITAADMSASKIPEEAWGMCSASENGVYSSEVSRLKKEKKLLQINYGWLEFKFAVLLATTTVFGLMSIVMLIVFIKERKKS